MKNVVFEVSSWGRSRDGATEHRQYVTSDKEYFVNNNSMVYLLSFLIFIFIKY